MHHPGPPRFTTVGEAVELAPRNPEPDATFRWRLTDAPADSEASLDDDPVVHLSPDVPGVYVAELDAPDGNHSVTVRAFPDVRRPATFRVADDDVDGDVSGAERVSVMGPFNEYRMGSHRAEREGGDDSENGDGGANGADAGNGEGAWILDAHLPPGDHDAIFAFDDAFDPYARAEVTVDGPGRPRLRLDGHLDGDEVVVRAAARAAPDGGDPAVEFHLDDRDALAREDVAIDGDELRVAVDALPESGEREPVRIHAVPVAERHGIADTLEIAAGDGGSSAVSDVAFSRPADAPGWVRDATIYQIFVRSFAGESVDTTFSEIERRVEYVESLGVDTVWLTPVLASPTDHGYHITDLFDTAADLGSREAFESMVERFHEAGIRVLFDLVINHTSRDHPAFQLHRAGVPAYADHYERVPVEEDATDVNWAGDDAPGVYFNWARIPNVNYDSLAVRRWMLDVVDEWAPVVDGFRCDVAWGVPHGFWKEVRERVKALDSSFLLLDETVPRDVAFRENEFDLHYDTDLYYALRDVGTGDAPASVLLDALDAAKREGFPDDAVSMRYVENHDETRYATDCGEGSLRAAAAATFTLPGAPLIYYGQERGVPEQRGTMRWHDGDADLTDWHRRLVELRNGTPALRAPGVDRVDYEVHEGDADRVVAYERSGGDAATAGDGRLVVVLNFAPEPATVALDRLDRSGGVEDLLSGDDVGVAGGGTDDGRIRVGDAVVLRVRPGV